jgi:uncharacterized membrane protein YdfJ with MMPL/SSD domain
VHSVYGNFPYVLAFVIILTFILLMRAFRSVVLALKAVVMNLISLGLAFGIVVFIFQQGHGSEAIWGIQATGPGPDIKQFGIGLAAGILIDATLIRSVLVPSFMRILGDANWWFPPAVARILFVKTPARPPERPVLETD